MATMSTIERQIEAVEGLHVIVRHPNGRNVRSDKMKLPSYPYRRARKNGTTVGQWSDTRFQRAFPGYTVDVLSPEGKKVHGRTLLSTVRSRQ